MRVETHRDMAERSDVPLACQARNGRARHHNARMIAVVDNEDFDRADLRRDWPQG